MELTAYELSVIAGAFTILGALIGALVTYRLALKLAKGNARREAARRLREAFSPELASLHPTAGDRDLNVEEALKAAFPRHHAAVIEFSYYLESDERNLFERAWRNYYEVGGSVRFFDYYMGTSPREVFQERVGAILRFTET